MTRTRPSVLIVDDVEANLIALDAALGSLACDVVRARSGNDALRELLKRDFAVMLLDVQMPEMDGFEVARFARENPGTRNVPIIFVTAMLETEEGALRGYGSGAVDFLFKPVNSRILQSKVQVFLDLERGRRELQDEIDAHKRTMAELDAFNHCVAHDLRAPLRPIGGYSQIVLDSQGDRLDADGKAYLQRIRNAADRMSQLIEDMLKLSQVTRTDVALHAIDVGALAASIVAELRREDPARDIEVILGQVSQPTRADPGLLRIALENLLRNAWKFTRKKARAVIEFGEMREQGTRVYFVRDNGAGFDPARAARLFRPFERLHTRADFEGTGIGLAIVQRIVGRHRGRVWAKGVPDEGASLFFTLNEPAG